MEDVKLHGAWPSPFSYRVIWALKLKGIPYEYVEEDLSNKSPQLLEYNFVHKTIPVLVHKGKPVCESMVILEYIEENWPQNPLLPSDPYESGLARFWAKFADDEGICIWTMFWTIGKQHEEAIKDCKKLLQTIENHALQERKKFFGGHNIGIVDIAFGGVIHWLRVLEDVLGIKLLEEHSFPRLHAWMKNFEEDPVIKENLPDRNDMFEPFKKRREMFLKSLGD